MSLSMLAVFLVFCIQSIALSSRIIKPSVELGSILYLKGVYQV